MSDLPSIGQKPSPWRGRGPWIAAGILGVLAFGLYLGRHRDGPQFSGFPSLTERGLFSNEPQAPPAQPQTQVEDSFSMIEKGKDSASPAAPAKAKTPADFFAAMDAIAKKEEPVKKPAASPSRLQAMASYFGSSGGGSGTAPSLSAPSSQALVQKPHPGPGALPQVERDRDFRAAYGDGSQGGRKGGSLSGDGLSSALSGKPGASSPMAGGSAHNAAAGPGGGPGNQGPSGGMPEAEGAGKAGTPTPPKAPDGKPVDAAKKGDAASDSAGKAASSASPSLGSAAGGQSGSWNSNQQSDDEIRTGVSSQGLAKDARAGSSLGSGLIEASQNTYLSAGGLAEPPRYSADSLLASKADDRTKVTATKGYTPDGVERAAKAGQEAPNPPKTSSGGALLNGVEGMRIGTTGRAEELVAAARKDLQDAADKASAYQLALKNGGKALSGRSDEVAALSKELVKSQENLQTGARDLEALKPKLNSLGQSWQAATTPQAKEPIVVQAAGLIQNYSTQAQTYSAESKRIETKAQPLAAKTSQDRKELRVNLEKAAGHVDASLTKLDGSIRALAAEVASAGSGLTGKEGDQTQLTRMRNNATTIVQELSASRQALQTSKLGYDKLAGRERRAGKALDEAIRGLGAE